MAHSGYKQLFSKVLGVQQVNCPYCFKQFPLFADEFRSVTYICPYCKMKLKVSLDVKQTLTRFVKSIFILIFDAIICSIIYSITHIGWVIFVFPIFHSILITYQSILPSMSAASKESTGKGETIFDIIETDEH